jgi:hypothetical protein
VAVAAILYGRRGVQIFCEDVVDGVNIVCIYSYFVELIILFTNFTHTHRHKHTRARAHTHTHKTCKKNM